MANPTNGDSFPSSSFNIPFSSIEKTDEDHSLSDTSVHSPIQPPLEKTRDSTTESSTNSSPDRPNRFYGDSGTYRDYIASERTLQTSLLHQRADDLSLHLYNTHALKLRVREPRIASAADHGLKPYHSKSRWVKRGEGGKTLWRPEDHWTAWPVRAEDVPRSGERFGLPSEWWEHNDAETFRVREAWRPTGQMEEEVLALMMRKGKEDFINSRGMVSSDFEGDAGGEGDVQRAEDDGEGEEDDDESTVAIQDTGTESEEAAMLADDETAAEILQPMVNYIMSKLDDLLLGLHESIGPTRSYTRRTQSQQRSKSASASQSRSRKRSRAATLSFDNEETESESPETANLSTAAPRSQSRRPSQRNSNPPQSPRRKGSTTSHSQNRMDPAKPRRRRPRHPRDWSALLATASLVGWDPEVLQRAHRRCEDLFSERTDFLPVPSVPSELPLPAAGSEREPPVGREGMTAALPDRTAEKKWIYCPVADCKRVEVPFHEKFRWREHMRRVHKWDKETVAREE